MLDWPILALYRSDKNLSGLVAKRENQVQKGELFDPKISTDYQRTIIGALAAGKDPRNFGGYNLVEAVKKSQLDSGKFADTISGGGDKLINSHIWGIISLYAAGEVIPNKDKALQWLVDHQNADGGFSIDTGVKSSDIDMTGMALIAFGALGENQNHPAVQKALAYLQQQQGQNGDFAGWGGSSSEALAQVIQGLVMLGIDPAGEQWTKKNGNLVTALLKYRLKDGSFSHTSGGKSNTIATYQSLLALRDYYSGESIYQVLRRKNLQFTDVPEQYFAAVAIRNLAAEGIISGYADGSFRPANPVTRQELITMLQRTLNKTGALNASNAQWVNFRTVSEDSVTGMEFVVILVRASGLESSVKTTKGAPWYDGYIRLAEQKGWLFPGFDPNKAVTRGQCAYSLAKLQ